MRNFHYLTGVPCTMQSRRGGGAGGGRRLRSGPRPALYDRNKFLAANFSFVVSDAADLAAASADPDLPLDWDDILQVRSGNGQVVQGYANEEQAFSGRFGSESVAKLSRSCHPSACLLRKRGLESQGAGHSLEQPSCLRMLDGFRPSCHRNLRHVPQVDMQTGGEPLTCPIALGPPVAPQITPCGHVFSFPAIVQHLVR